MGVRSAPRAQSILSVFHLNILCFHRDVMWEQEDEMLLQQVSVRVLTEHDKWTGLATKTLAILNDTSEHSSICFGSVSQLPTIQQMIRSDG